jgi:hypothetical protein
MHEVMTWVALARDGDVTQAFDASPVMSRYAGT